MYAEAVTLSAIGLGLDDFTDVPDAVGVDVAGDYVARLVHMGCEQPVFGDELTDAEQLVL